MDTNAIPALVLFFLLFFSAPQEAKAAPGISNERKVHIESPLSINYDPKAEYQSIYTYITTKYKKISKEDAEQISQYLVDYGREHSVDPKLAAALMARESSFNKKAVSVTGAKGLGQIKSFNYPSLKIKDPFDIKQNVQGTVTYLNRMLNVWKAKSEKTSLALASYYKGHNALKRQNEKMDAVTKHYVEDVLNVYQDIKDLRTQLTQKVALKTK